MDQIYLTEINIRQVRHLQDVKIELSQNEKKHLLLTGINGCGKTSVLSAISGSLFQLHAFMGGEFYVVDLNHVSDKIQIKSNLSSSIDGREIYKLYKEGQIILISFSADRKFEIKNSKAVEVVDISSAKAITENMNDSFGKLLIYLYIEKLLAKEKGDMEKADTFPVCGFVN